MKRSAAVILLALGVWGFIAYWTSTNDCDRKVTALNNPMKAIVQCEYGGPDVLKLEEVEKPVPNDNQVLIKVRAASLNFIDAGIMRGPIPLRLMGTGLRKPTKTMLGQDVAGQVEAVGKNVTQFKPGDEVFGLARDSLAEYVCARERALVIKPANVKFEQAACGGIAALTALQGLRTGKIQPGQKVLINGASGGVGTFAVQIAKSLGAEVTAVCSTEQGRSCPINRRRSRHRLHQGRLHQERATLRYDLRQRSAIIRVPNAVVFLTSNGICVLAGIGSAGVREGQCHPGSAETSQHSSRRAPRVKSSKCIRRR